MCNRHEVIVRMKQVALMCSSAISFSLKACAHSHACKCTHMSMHARMHMGKSGSVRRRQPSSPPCCLLACATGRGSGLCATVSVRRERDRERDEREKRKEERELDKVRELQWQPASLCLAHLATSPSGQKTHKEGLSGRPPPPPLSCCFSFSHLRVVTVPLPRSRQEPREEQRAGHARRRGEVEEKEEVNPS